MSEKNTGGTAFPSSNNVRVGEFVSGGHEGMTLRDYFAAKAMQGFCADPNVDESADMMAKASYQVADAMLKAREA